jgi:hypothetical protein
VYTLRVMARLAEHGPRRSAGIPGLFSTVYGKVRGPVRGAVGRAIGRRQDPDGAHSIHYVERPPDFEALGYRTVLVPIFGDDVSATAIGSAAKLIGRDGVVYAIFVLSVPSHLSLEAGLEEEEARGRSVLEGARIQARRAGLKIHTGLIRTRNPGAALVEEALRLRSDVIYWSTLHAPAGERRIGPTAVYLLGKRPCRVIIETEAENVTRTPAVPEPGARSPHAPA